jgi:MFS family permease
MQVVGLKRTMIGCLTILMAGTALSTFMMHPWQLFLTWGLMVGIGSGAGAVGFAAAVANRWFVRRAGLAMGLLTSANAAGQLIFLPLLALLVQHYGWQGVSITMTAVTAVVIPMVILLLPESPASVGLPAYGARTVIPIASVKGENPFAVAFGALVRSSGSMDFWLLCLTFGICGFSTNGLINTHLIAYCADNGISPVNGASILAVIGLFSLIGSTASGWLCDRYNPRVLLFWYYGLRGLSLVIMPFTAFDSLSLSVFSVFYGLDWVATGPATFALTNQVFGRRDAPVIVSWIFAAHQVGGAIAAFGAGAVRSLSGSYLIAFIASGVACLLASMLVLRVTPRGAPAALAER